MSSFSVFLRQIAIVIAMIEMSTTEAVAAKIAISILGSMFLIMIDNFMIRRKNIYFYLSKKCATCGSTFKLGHQLTDRSIGCPLFNQSGIYQSGVS